MHIYKKNRIISANKISQGNSLDIDYSQYARALSNLIDNAGKYSVANSEVFFQIKQR